MAAARRRGAARAGLRRSGVWDGMDWVGIWSLAGSVTSAMLVLSIGPIVGWTCAGDDHVRGGRRSSWRSSSSGSR